MKQKTKEQSLLWLKIQRESFHRKWFARDNFIFAEGSCVADKPVAECGSALIALHIVCAHNAVLESAKDQCNLCEVCTNTKQDNNCPLFK